MPLEEVQLFAPNDRSIPKLLKSRIGKWRDTTPSQFQQYGPINKYLGLKFNRDEHMIKPQALIRTPIEEADDALLLNWGEEDDDPLPPDDDERERLLDLRCELQEGNITTDSTRKGFVYKSNTAGQKVYPDFVVCEYTDGEHDPVPSQVHERENVSKDKVRLVMEIATLPKGLTEMGLDRLRDKTLEQLQEYMRRVDDGARWVPGKAMGVALVGTEVAFLVPRKVKGEYQWKLDGNRWYSLFDDKFRTMITRAARY